MAVICIWIGHRFNEIVQQSCKLSIGRFKKVEILQINLLSGQEALQFQLLRHLIPARLHKSQM